MPLIEVRQITPSTRLGLWQMTEKVEELCELLPDYRDEALSLYRSESRRKEFLSVRALLRRMTRDSSLRIEHEASGKPTLAGWNISISHTHGYAALMLSNDERVGLDIEKRSDRVHRIAHKYVRPDEQAATTEKLLALWSAKETLYKLYSEDRLMYFDMRICSMGAGKMMAENLKRRERVIVSYEFKDDYVMTWATHSGSSPQPCTIQTT